MSTIILNDFYWYGRRSKPGRQSKQLLKKLDIMDKKLSQLSSQQVKTTKEDALVLVEPDHSDSTEMLEDKNDNLK